MKKILLFSILTLIFTSCEIDDNNPPNFVFEVVPIQNVTIPDEFQLGQTYEITVQYIRPNDCYEFNDFYFTSAINERTIAVINTVFLEDTCNTLNEPVEASFDFIANSLGTFVFRFWQGEDEFGEDIYLVFEIPVVE